MLQPKAVIRFVLLAIAIYSPLAFPARLWPAWEQTYASVFRLGGSAFFSQFWVWPEASVRFLDLRSESLVADINNVMPGELPDGFRPPRRTTDKDTLLLLMNRNTPGPIGMLRTGSHMMGYVPTSVLIALILATPFRWSRRGWALLWGMILVHAFIAVRLSAMLIHSGFGAPGKAYALFKPGLFWQGTLARIDEVLADNPTFAYVAPVCLWMLILFGFQLWSTWRDKQHQARGKS